MKPELQNLIDQIKEKKNIQNVLSTEYLYEAVAYLRYSSHRQDGGVSIEYQISEVLAYAEKEKIRITGWYIDTAKSGKEVAGRDDFIRLFNDVERGDVPPNLIIFATNRAFRNNGESHQYRAILRKKGIVLHSATQRIDEKTSSGRMHINMLATIDQYQSDTISDFVSAATRYLISEGFFAGGIPPFGFTTEKVMHNGKGRTKLIPYEPEAAVVREIFESVAAGKNLGHIAKTLTERGITARSGKPFHWEVLYKILTNIVYKGERLYKMANGDNAFCQNYCTPIVSKELFANANKTHEANKKKPKGRHRKNIYPLTGKLTCPSCGRAMVGTCSNKNLYYKCDSRHRNFPCTTKAIRKPQLDKMAFDAVREHILSDKAIEDITKKVLSYIKKAPAVAEDKKELSNRKSTLEKEITDVVRMKLKGTISESVLESLTRELEAELAIINRKLAELELSVNPSIDALYIKKHIKAIFNKDTPFVECSQEMLKELFAQTVKDIEVGNTQVVIHLRIPLSDNKDKTSYGFPNIEISVKMDRPNNKRRQ